MERVMGIEPTLVAWEATVLPLNYTRRRRQILGSFRTASKFPDLTGLRSISNR